MKNSGLKNRFPPSVRNVWIFWYDCMVCGRNRIDALHHIVSPSSHFYIDGKHNESVFNSCPIHNFGCHIDNEAFLYRDETIKMLLKKTQQALEWEGYKPNALDKKFLEIYAKLYV